MRARASVSGACLSRSISIPMSDSATCETYRTTESASRNADLDALLRLETVNRPLGQKVRRFLRTAQDLQ